MCRVIIRLNFVCPGTFNPLFFLYKCDNHHVSKIKYNFQSIPQYTLNTKAHWSRPTIFQIKYLNFYDWLLSRSFVIKYYQETIKQGKRFISCLLSQCFIFFPTIYIQTTVKIFWSFALLGRTLPHNGRH